MFLENLSSLRRPILVNERLPSVGRPIRKLLPSIGRPIRMASVGRPIGKVLPRVDRAIGKRLPGGRKLRGGGNDRLGADGHLRPRPPASTFIAFRR